jgi:hypothetical protein
MKGGNLKIFELTYSTKIARSSYMGRMNSIISHAKSNGGEGMEGI